MAGVDNPCQSIYVKQYNLQAELRVDNIIYWRVLRNSFECTVDLERYVSLLFIDE